MDPNLGFQDGIKLQVWQGSGSELQVRQDSGPGSTGRESAKYLKYVEQESGTGSGLNNKQETPENKPKCFLLNFLLEY